MDKCLEHEQGKYRPVEALGRYPGHRRPMPDDDWPYVSPSDGFDVEYGVRAVKHEYHVFIRRDQVLYDVEAQLAMMATSRRREDGTEEDAPVTATERYRPMFDRWIDKHTGLAKGQMSAFVLERHTKTSMNGGSSPDEFDITLLMPAWWDETVLSQLTQSVHDYLVNAVMYEYLSIASSMTGKNGDPVMVSKKEMADEALHNVKVYVNAAKPGRVRKTQKPF